VTAINQSIMLTTNSVEQVQNMWSLASALPVRPHKTGRISLPLSCHLTCQFYWTIDQVIKLTIEVQLLAEAQRFSACKVQTGSEVRAW